MRYILLAHRVLAGLCLVLFLAGVALAGGEQPSLVIVDNDFNGPPSTLSNLRAALMFLESPEVRVLGFTVVTGDGWRDEEVSHLLRLLEITGRKDIPVVPGAVFPLVNSQEEIEAWEKLYGPAGYKGAFDSKMAFNEVPALPEGMPAIQAAHALAPVFMIEQVHAHPHEVSICAAGPLTNLALAIRLDPDFPRLVKELVFEGAFQKLGYADFNTRFDPEAAHIVLTAQWPSITSVADITSEPIYSSKEIFSAENVSKIMAAKTPIADYVVRYSEIDISKGWAVWDELAAAVLIDPAIVTESEDTYLDVHIDHDKDYGRVNVWDDKTVPRADIRKIRVVKKIDSSRFESLFMKSMTAAPTTS